MGDSEASLDEKEELPGCQHYKRNCKLKCSQSCRSCEQVFGNYFCDICHFYDNVDKKQFHCDKCGICRIGGRENFFHCETCDMCLSSELKAKHKCLENASKNNCPVCLEDLHTSTDPCHIPHCTHMIHRNYACPVCAESMVEMKEVWRHLDEEVAVTPMPEDYQNTKVNILCRDCHKESEILFHILGLKCQLCGSYNTCRTGLSVPSQTTS
ncbi:RING finger and CHY zinc finger domain-containing protein 1 [Nymphon striatum]|nr:RING finger and CHY zinc finger domain-containing protein 1 [Nymphon striatum]